MSEDLIRRSDAIKALGDAHFKNWGNAVMVIQDLPSADRPPKVVAQITFDEEKLREIVKEAVERFKEEYEIKPKRCEYCKDGSFIGQKKMLGNDGTWHRILFCPNCGADMRGKDDE